MPKLYNCPYHDDTNASLAIYEETSSYYCFGCKKHGKLTEQVLDNIDFSTEFKTARVNFAEYKELQMEGIQFLNSRNISVKTAMQYGISEKQGDSILMPIQDDSFKLSGMLVRFLYSKQKYKTIPMDGSYPKYARVLVKNNDKQVYLVESILDALALYDAEGIGSYVLLGMDLKEELAVVLQKHGFDVIIYLDPDAINEAYLIRNHLRSYNINAIVREEDTKPYELNRE